MLYTRTHTPHTRFGLIYPTPHPHLYYTVIHTHTHTVTLIYHVLRVNVLRLPVTRFTRLPAHLPCWPFGLTCSSFSSRIGLGWLRTRSVLTVICRLPHYAPRLPHTDGALVHLPHSGTVARGMLVVRTVYVGYLALYYLYGWRVDLCYRFTHTPLPVVTVLPAQLPTAFCRTFGWFGLDYLFTVGLHTYGCSSTDYGCPTVDLDVRRYAVTVLVDPVCTLPAAH